MSATRARTLRAMGIERWVLRQSEQQAETGAEQLTAHARSPGAGERDRHCEIANMDWGPLAASVAGCTACPLHAGRRQAVLGTGDRAARWMFVGEAPGAEEDRRGEPFVGRAGQLLNAMLAAVGVTREQVYITNILKCRPPNNRDPVDAEAQCCAPYLERQIALVAPTLLIALGRISAQRLLGTDAPLGRLRGRVHSFSAGQNSLPVIVTYHPAYLLRSPREKRKAWEDLRLALANGSPT